MVRTTILLFAFLLSGGLVKAQQAPVFTVKVSTDSVLMGNYFQVSFTLENANGQNFAAPNFTRDFDVVSGPNISTSMSMMNGQVSQKVSYTYYLQPRETGSFFIEPASIETDDNVLETAPIEVFVVPNPDGIQQQPMQPKGPGGFFDAPNGTPLPGMELFRLTPEDLFRQFGPDDSLEPFEGQEWFEQFKDQGGGFRFKILPDGLMPMSPDSLLKMMPEEWQQLMPDSIPGPQPKKKKRKIYKL